MTSGTSRGSVPAISPSWPTEAAGLWTKAFRHLAVAVAVYRERRKLAGLDERMLKDIGLSRSMAAREVARDFFDLPEHRIGE